MNRTQPTTTHLRSHRSRLGRIGLIVGLTLLIVAFWLPKPAGSRETVPSLDAQTDLLLIRHPLLGALAKPRQTFQMQRPGAPAESATINAFGFRGPDPTSDASLPQLAIVGDESLFGLGLPDSALAPAQLQTRLAETADPSVPVLNLSTIAGNIESKLNTAIWVVESFPLRGIAICLGPFDRWSYFDRVRQTARQLDQRNQQMGWMGLGAPALPGRSPIPIAKVESLLNQLQTAAQVANVQVVFDVWQTPPSDSQTKAILEQVQSTGFPIIAIAEQAHPDQLEQAHQQLAIRLLPWAQKAISLPNHTNPVDTHRDRR